VAVPLALQVPWKAGDAQTVLDSLNPSDEAVARTEEYMAMTRAGMAELEASLLPDAAETLGLTEDELDTQLATDYPEFSAALDEMPDVLGRYEARAQIRVEGADDIATLKDVPIRILGWFVPVYGLVVAGAAAAAWRLRPASTPAVELETEPEAEAAAD
jgi:hypothetical protein